MRVIEKISSSIREITISSKRLHYTSYIQCVVERFWSPLKSNVAKGAGFEKKHAFLFELIKHSSFFPLQDT